MRLSVSLFLLDPELWKLENFEQFLLNVAVVQKTFLSLTMNSLSGQIKG
jgi:hypothetical protein